MGLQQTLESLPAWPAADFSQFGETEIQPLTRIQKISSGFLTRNWLSIPHVTQHDEVDVTDLEIRRVAHNAAMPGGRVSAPVLVAKALVAVLQRHPRFNASIDADGANLVLKRYFHIGFAVDTPAGLLVAVIRDCDRKSPVEIAGELFDTAERARAKGLSMTEMSGGCITVTSLGHIGGVSFTPIINAPEVAIVGLSRTARRAFQDRDGGLMWRDLLPVSLSYDHRVINGADAARFVVDLGEELGKLTW